MSLLHGFSSQLLVLLTFDVCLVFFLPLATKGNMHSIVPAFCVHFALQKGRNVWPVLPKA